MRLAAFMRLHCLLNNSNVSFYVNTQRLKGGTTAVVSLIRGNLLLTAWLGDSQAVLVKDGVATQLVNPHKPDRIVNNSKLVSIFLF
jgi:serine/threonine protein phosphatase PrpC